MRSRNEEALKLPLVQGMSIACSTPEALKWDPEWAGTHEISGRAMKNVHTAGSEFNVKRCAAILSHCTSMLPAGVFCTPLLDGKASPTANSDAWNFASTHAEGK